MTETSMFFSDGSYYDQEVFARFLKDIFAHNGVVADIDDKHVVTAPSGNMTVKVGTGRAYVNGFIHEILTDPVTLDISAAEENSRIDRVVLQLNLTENKIAVVILKGTAAASPTAPELTQNSTKWEEPLYQVMVRANTTSILESDLTDERQYMWYSRDSQPKASKTEYGSVKVGDGISVTDGVISIPYTPFPMTARMYDTDQGLGSLIVNNVYNGTVGQLPMGILIQNAGGSTSAKSIAVSATVRCTVGGTPVAFSATATNCLTGATREVASGTGGSSRGSEYTMTATANCMLEEIISIGATTGDLVSSSIGTNNTYLGRPTT